MNTEQKAKAIEALNAKPFEVGDIVTIVPPADARPGSLAIDGCEVVAVDGGLATIDCSDSHKRQSQGWIDKAPFSPADDNTYRTPKYHVPVEYLRHATREVGANPFKATTWRDHVQYLNYGICSVMSRAGIGLDGKPSTLSGGDFRMEFDPVVTDANGNPRHYQRGSVWTHEQRLAFLDSIYNRSDIGRIVLRERKGGNCDVVDGKQRLETIMAFMRDELADRYGNTFGGLSDIAQSAFTQHPLPTAILPVSTTDAQVLEIFLDVNAGGTVVAPEHIAAVRQLQNACMPKAPSAY